MKSSETLYKYPRTYHAPWSLGSTSDDKIHATMEQFAGKRVIVTEKLDGECTTLTPTKHYARSLDSAKHPSQDWIRRFHGVLSYQIPEGYRMCGENVYALHSIFYENLESYFYGFSMWKDNLCLSWEDTIEWFSLLGIIPVPVLYDGIYDEAIIKKLWNPNDGTEGYVIRVAEEFEYSTFKDNVAKFVRPNHVTSDKHWKHKAVIQNKLKSQNNF